jgi:hypothetical protein
MGMLTDEEKRELRELARSTTMRDEFRSLKNGPRLARSTPLDLDRFIEFLTAMSRFQPISPREAPEYRNARI